MLKGLKSALTDHPSPGITGFVLITPTAYVIEFFCDKQVFMSTLQKDHE